MHIFYTPDINGLEYIFNEEESKHAIRVLRLTVGDLIQLIDGKGSMFEAVITDAHPKRCKVLVKNIINPYEKRPYNLHIGISPLKSPDRFEWFLEKATEIGVDEITPILCHHSEKKLISMDRCNRIIEAAMKQSVKAFHPVLNPLIKFEEIIKSSFTGKKLIATCEGDRKSLISTINAGDSVLVLIGPEGDFSEEEINASLRNAFIPITLGNSRLRSETASIAVCLGISLLNQVVDK